jgi:hypothetical protein
VRAIIPSVQARNFPTRYMEKTMQNCDKCYRIGNCSADFGDSRCVSLRRERTLEEDIELAQRRARIAAIKAAAIEAEKAAAIRAAERLALQCQDDARELALMKPWANPRSSKW